MPDEPITILRLTKSGGCVDREESYMRQVRQAQIRNYFFGDSKTALSPHTQVVDSDMVTVFRMGDRKSTLQPQRRICSNLPRSKRNKRRPPPPRRRPRRQRQLSSI